MKVLQSMNHLSRSGGGLYQSVSSLSNFLADKIDITVIGWRDQYFFEDKIIWEDLDVVDVKAFFPNIIGYSPQYTKTQRADYDLVHVHGIWRWPSVAVVRWKKTTGKPYMVSPRGMLSSHALQISGLKKKIALKLFVRKYLERADMLHALNEREAEAFRAFGLTNPICVIPNGVVIPQLLDPLSKKEDEVHRMLYLGRLHPIKGLDRLIKGWVECSSSKDAQLLIAGWGDEAYKRELIALCNDIGINIYEMTLKDYRERQMCTNKPGIYFLGSCYAEEKDQVLRLANSFVLTSRSEAMPMSLLEASSYGLPVLCTRECNNQDAVDVGVAVLISDSEQSLECTRVAHGIAAILGMDDNERREMGRLGRDFVEKNYLWSDIANNMNRVYHWLCGQGERPDDLMYKG